MWSAPVPVGLFEGLRSTPANVWRNLTLVGMFGTPKTAAGIRKINRPEPVPQALKALRELTAHNQKARSSPITAHAVRQRSNGYTSRRPKGTQKPHYCIFSIGTRWNAAVKRADIRRRNPYHTRHTFACWLLSAGATPLFYCNIASQMGHENVQMAYDVYGAGLKRLITFSVNAEQHASALIQRAPFMPLLVFEIVKNARKSAN